MAEAVGRGIVEVGLGDARAEAQSAGRGGGVAEGQEPRVVQVGSSRARHSAKGRDVGENNRGGGSGRPLPRRGGGGPMT